MANPSTNGPQKHWLSLNETVIDSFLRNYPSLEKYVITYYIFFMNIAQTVEVMVNSDGV